LTAHGRLVTSHLGRAVLIEAMSKALVTAMFSFMGALLPLMVGVLWPILALVVALVTLTVLGGILGNTAHGRPLTWAVSMLVGCIGVLYIGFFLKIV
jgi:VIT1/CCC1 family predicted Fe2+/Mn2+ transporter